MSNSSQKLKKKRGHRRAVWEEKKKKRGKNAKQVLKGVEPLSSRSLGVGVRRGLDLGKCGTYKLDVIAVRPQNLPQQSSKITKYIKVMLHRICHISACILTFIT